MNWSTGLTWLAGLKPSHAFSADDADPADMGTAFGLDASFDHPDVDPIPAGAVAADMPWEYRLTRRTGL